MKILITGSNGMLGHDLKRVLEKDHDLILTTSQTLDITDKEKTKEKTENPEIFGLFCIYLAIKSGKFCREASFSPSKT